jgi:excisionase family DNA binding protein
MTKEEVAQLLGVSTRAVERYTQAGKLSVKYEKGKTRPVAIYDAEEVKTLKVTIDNPPLHRPTIPPIPDNPTTQALIPTNPDQDRLAAFVGIVASQFEQARSKHQPVPLADKLTLTLIEAAQLSGLSKQRLREAIRDEKLHGQILGRGWKIKRGDLENYIKKL